MLFVECMVKACCHNLLNLSKIADLCDVTIVVCYIILLHLKKDCLQGGGVQSSNRARCKLGFKLFHNLLNYIFPLIIHLKLLKYQDHLHTEIKVWPCCYLTLTFLITIRYRYSIKDTLNYSTDFYNVKKYRNNRHTRRYHTIVKFYQVVQLTDSIQANSFPFNHPGRRHSACASVMQLYRLQFMVHSWRVSDQIWRLYRIALYIDLNALIKQHPANSAHCSLEYSILCVNRC